MSEIPDVPDDVIERLASGVLDDMARDNRFSTWRHASSGQIIHALVAHLRAHPEDAAAVLGGEVYHEWERRGLIDREPFDDAGRIRDVLTVDYPWREVTGG